MEGEGRMSERDLEREPVAHRTGRSDPTGKLSATIELSVSEEMADEIAMAATALRISKSEFVRLCIAKELFGRSYLMRRSVGAPDE